MEKRNLESINVVHEKFFRIVELYKTLEKTPRSWGTDELLTSSEIQLIENIGDSDEKAGVTDLAKVVGITKGAVSQTLKKLEKKGITDKEEDPENISRSIVKLTTKGKAAYYAHKHWHETLDDGYISYYNTLEQEQIDFLVGFMSRVEKFFKNALASMK